MDFLYRSEAFFQMLIVIRLLDVSVSIHCETVPVLQSPLLFYWFVNEKEFETIAQELPINLQPQLS
jgi:hypothetical protein